MVTQYTKYDPTPTHVSRYLPGSLLKEFPGQYNLHTAMGTWGTVKETLVIPVKQRMAGGYVTQRGSNTYDYKIPKKRLTPVLKFLPRGGNIMRVVGTQGDIEGSLAADQTIPLPSGPQTMPPQSLDGEPMQQEQSDPTMPEQPSENDEEYATPKEAPTSPEEATPPQEYDGRTFGGNTTTGSTTSRLYPTVPSPVEYVPYVPATRPEVATLYPPVTPLSEYVPYVPATRPEVATDRRVVSGLPLQSDPYPAHSKALLDKMWEHQHAIDVAATNELENRIDMLYGGKKERLDFEMDRLRTEVNDFQMSDMLERLTVFPKEDGVEAMSTDGTPLVIDVANGSYGVYDAMSISSSSSVGSISLRSPSVSSGLLEDEQPALAWTTEHDQDRLISELNLRLTEIATTQQQSVVTTPFGKRPNPKVFTRIPTSKTDAHVPVFITPPTQVTPPHPDFTVPTQVIVSSRRSSTSSTESFGVGGQGQRSEDIKMAGLYRQEYSASRPGKIKRKKSGPQMKAQRGRIFKPSGTRNNNFVNSKEKDEE